MSSPAAAQLSNYLVNSSLLVLTGGMVTFAAALASSRSLPVEAEEGDAAADADADLAAQPQAGVEVPAVTGGGDRVPSVGAVARGTQTAVAPTAVAPRGGASGGGTGTPPAGAEPAAADVGGAPASREDRLNGVGLALTWLSFLLVAGGVLARGVAAGRAPWGNMYEFSITACVVILAVYLGLQRRRPSLVHLGLYVTLPVLTVLGLAVSLFYVPAGPLMPALHSVWLVVHVSCAIISGAVFTVGATATVLFLLQDYWERTGKAPRASRRLPTADALDELSYKLYAFVFPLWTFAIIAGAIWAESAWGRYWGWDPKETWSFITWVVFAAYLHARATAGWRGRRAAYIALAGLSCFVFDFVGVNIWLTGLHSYGGLPQR